MFSKLFSWIGIFFLRLLSAMPLWFLYIKSDFLFFLIFYIFKYRRETVVQNLKNSFPEKSDQDIYTIMKLFYRHLSDIFIEAIFRPGKHNNKIYNRIDTSDIELLNSYYENGRSIILLSIHYGNWEWTKYFAKLSKHKNLLVYNVQRNQIFDKYLKSIRSEYNAVLVPKSKIYQALKKSKAEQELTMTLLVADQTPEWNCKFWTMFLNQETPFFPGPAKLAKKLDNQPILFLYMKKTGRGRYKVVIEPFIDNPSEFSENEIIRLYAQKAEEIIRAKPEYYLWSHRRWKYKRPFNIPLIN